MTSYGILYDDYTYLTYQYTYMFVSDTHTCCCYRITSIPINIPICLVNSQCENNKPFELMEYDINGTMIRSVTVQNIRIPGVFHTDLLRYSNYTCYSKVCYILTCIPNEFVVVQQRATHRVFNLFWQRDKFGEREDHTINGLIPNEYVMEKLFLNENMLIADCVIPPYTHSKAGYYILCKNRDAMTMLLEILMEYTQFEQSQVVLHEIARSDHVTYEPGEWAKACCKQLFDMEIKN